MFSYKKSTLVFFHLVPPPSMDKSLIMNLSTPPCPTHPPTARWLTQAGYNEDLLLSALALLHALCSHGRALERLSENQFRILGAQLSSWLRHASKNSLATPSSGISLFSSTSRKQVAGYIIAFIFTYTVVSTCHYIATLLVFLITDMDLVAKIHQLQVTSVVCLSLS